VKVASLEILPVACPMVSRHVPGDFLQVASLETETSFPVLNAAVPSNKVIMFEDYF